MRIFLILLVVLAIAAMAYVRLSPINVGQAHLPTYPSDVGDYPQGNGFIAARKITTAPDGILRAIDGIIMDTPRTMRLAGTPQEGLMTYVTRSRFIGFPDITTVEVGSTIEGDTSVLRINGRARFGVLDLGVNEARIKGWLAQLGPLVVPLP